MKKDNYLQFGLVITLWLLVACVETSTLATSPTATLQPTGTPTPMVTTTATPDFADFVPVTPLATAPALRFAGWLPDSRWIAYWASSREDVDNYAAYSFPAGTLHLANVETGMSCAVPEFVARGEPITVRWSDDGAVIVLTADGAFTGQPCQPEPYAALADYTPDERQVADPALSPDGRYRTATTLQASENGVLTFETALSASDEAQPRQRVTWKIDERIGDYGLGGEWISQSQFLIYESLTEGPLILDVDQGIIAVLTKLFGLEEVPSILDERGYGLRAIPAPGVEPDTFHLLLTGVGLEGNFPSVMLYHAERGLVETLPFRSVWWKPFSDDHQWLLMDERPDVGGYESHAIWIRRVEDIDGEWRLLATGVDSVLWSDDGKEMVFTDDALVTWQTFPSAELIGRWDTGEFSTHPVARSPNGHFLVTEGNVPGEWQFGLFVLERSLVATPAPQSTPSPSPEPAQDGHGVTPPPGLVYRTLDGLWRVDADGQPQQLLTNPDAQLSPDGQRALYWDGTGIWVVDLTTGAEYNLLAGNDRPTCCPQWADAETILFGYWPEGTEPGPSTGYLSAATIDSSWVRVLNESSASNGLPAASPDGQMIAYDQGGTAWLYRWGSGSELFDLAVYDLPQSKSLKIGSPAWSPDGRKLAWIVGGGFGPGRGYRIGVAIFDLEAKTAQLRHLYEPVGVGGWPPAPAWSPDGQWLALVAWEWVPEGPQRGNLWLLSADGSVQDQLLLKAVGLGGRPVWSPNGRWLLFTQQVAGKETAVWRFETGVWQPQQLELPFDATVLAWTSFTLDGVFFDHQCWYYDSARVVSER